MTGPVYEREMKPLPNAKEVHKVPSGYWKIVCVEKGGAISVAAFFFDQETLRNDKILDHHETVRVVEEKCGLDFLWLLEDSLEAALETEKDQAFAQKYFSQD